MFSSLKGFGYKLAYLDKAGEFYAIADKNPDGIHPLSNFGWNPKTF